MNAELFGQLAGIVSLISFLPYIYSTIWGETKPNRVTWWTWSGVQIILTITFWQSSKNHEAIWVSIGYTFGTLLVAILSIQKGHSDKMDWVSIYGIGITIMVWLFAGALSGLITILMIDLWASIPTIKKSKSDPKSESLSSWVIGFIANLLNLLAIQHWNEVSILYPLYLFMLTGTVSYILLSTPRQKSK